MNTASTAIEAEKAAGKHARNANVREDVGMTDKLTYKTAMPGASIVGSSLVPIQQHARIEGMSMRD